MYIPYVDWNITNKYLIFTIYIIGIYLGSKVIVFLLKKVLLALAKKTKTKVDDYIIEKTRRSFVKLFVYFGIKYSLNVLELPEKTAGVVDNIIGTVIIYYIAKIVIRVVDIILDEWGRIWSAKTKSSMDDELLPLFHKSSKAILIILTIIFMFNQWEIDVTGLLAGVGIAGIAIGFAVKDSLANIFGGISLILDRSIKIGDIIRTDAGESGKIIDVGLRSTRIKSWDGEVIIVPNGVMANSKLWNVTQPDLAVRITLDFGTAYGSDPEQVKEIVTKAIKGVKGIYKEKDVVVRFVMMADFSLNFKAYLWVEDVDIKWDVHQRAITAVYKALNDAKISIPFPTHSVLLENAEAVPKKMKIAVQKKKIKKKVTKKKSIKKKR